MNMYARYLNRLKRGFVQSPRGMAVHALYNQVYRFVPGTCWRRKHDNPAIGFIEGLQFIAGTASTEAISAAAPSVNLGLFGPTSFYGPRTVGQFNRVVYELTKYPDSRRAVVMVAHPDDTPESMPCTTSMTFYINQQTDKLDCVVSLRSSDSVWGLPYDQIQYGMVTLALASCIGVKVGEVTVNIVNAHVYDDHPGSNNWEAGIFKMPVYTYWSKYVEWAQSVVDFRPSRSELEELFSLRSINGG